MKELNVIVVGGGIGGLQTALALGSDGHKVTVLESAKEFLEVRFSLFSSFLTTNGTYPVHYLLTLRRLGWRRNSRSTKFLALEPWLGCRFR